MSGLDKLPKAEVLYVNRNALSSLVGIEPLAATLTFLSAANNRLTSIDQLAGFTALKALDLENNQLDDPALIDFLGKVWSVRFFSIVVANRHHHSKPIKSARDCSICICRSSTDTLLSTISKQNAPQFPWLVYLNLKGNPLVTRVQDYRKKLIAAVPLLDTLDGPRRGTPYIRGLVR